MRGVNGSKRSFAKLPSGKARSLGSMTVLGIGLETCGRFLALVVAVASLVRVRGGGRRSNARQWIRNRVIVGIQQWGIPQVTKAFHIDLVAKVALFVPVANVSLVLDVPRITLIGF